MVLANVLNRQRRRSGGGGTPTQPPANLTPPTITRNGMTLTCDPGDWANSPTSITYRWLLNGTAVIGATSQSWTMPASAPGSLFGCELVGVNSAGQSLPTLAQEVYIGILDVLNLPFVGFSSQRLAAGYVGAGMRARNSSNNPATQDKDILFASSGWLDNASVLSHTGAGDGLFVTWYDQGGTNKNAVEVVAVNQPRIVTAGVMETENNRPTMRLIRANNTGLLTSAFNLATTNSGLTGKYLVSAVFKKTTLSSGPVNNFDRLWVAEPDQFTVGYLGGGNAPNTLLSMAASGNISAPIVTINNSLSVVSNAFACAGYGASVNAISVNGGTDAISPNNTGGLNTGRIAIGNTGLFSNGWDGALSELIFIAADATAEQRTLLRQNRMAQFSVTP